MGRNSDRLVVERAARRHSLVTTAELNALGIDRHGITRRIARGWFRRMHRGVYLVGPAEGPLTREAAALLACGDRAVLSHHSAAAIWGIRPREVGPVAITLLDGDRRRREGIRIHRASDLTAQDVTLRHELRVTAPARTLLDLAATLEPPAFADALNEALVNRLTAPPVLLSRLARGPAHRGGPSLARALQAHPGITRSEAERRLQTLIRKAGLPRPRTNVRVAGHEVDCFWPDLGLVVEVDSRTFHDTPRAYRRDRRKEADLHDAGHRATRITCWEIVHEPERTIARLARATAARPP